MFEEAPISVVNILIVHCNLKTGTKLHFLFFASFWNLKSLYLLELAAFGETSMFFAYVMLTVFDGRITTLRAKMTTKIERKLAPLLIYLITLFDDGGRLTITER